MSQCPSSSTRPAAPQELWPCASELEDQRVDVAMRCERVSPAKVTSCLSPLSFSSTSQLYRTVLYLLSNFHLPPFVAAASENSHSFDSHILALKYSIILYSSSTPSVLRHEAPHHASYCRSFIGHHRHCIRNRPHWRCSSRRSVTEHLQTAPRYSRENLGWTHSQGS